MLRTVVLSLLILFQLTLVSCGDIKLFSERRGESRYKVFRGYFSGIHYMSIRGKHSDKPDELHVIDCEPTGTGEPGYSMSIMQKKGLPYGYKAVTDTTEELSYFNWQYMAIQAKRPFEFRPITQNERAVLKRAITPENCSCFDGEKMKVEDIIGYVRSK